jgi:TetR/AcrR family transcriptional regulator, repressor for uid operon
MRKIDPKKHEQKRQRILGAAGRCFARSGFRGARIADICAAARISPGHLYHYFSSKEAIIDAMAERGTARVIGRLAHMAEQTDALQALHAGLGESKGKRGYRQPRIAIEIIAEASRNTAVAGILRRHGQGVRKLLAKYLRDGQLRGQIDGQLDVDAISALLLGVMQGLECLSIMEPAFRGAQRNVLLQLLIGRLLAPQASVPAIPASPQ